MMVSKVTEYRQRGKDNLRKAFKELDERDLTQASEKGWGHASHVQIHNRVNDLVRQTGDTALNRLFLVANSLHGNFYEGWFLPEQVEEGLQAVQQFVNKMDFLLDA